MSPVEQLVQRLSAEVAAATDRVHGLQLAAGQYAKGQEHRFQGFVALSERIDSIFLPRIKAFMNLDVFKGIQKSVVLERRGNTGRELHGGTMTLVVPYSEECPAKVALSFRLGHDGPIQNAILEYDLDIVPIFIAFQKHDEMLIPIFTPDETAIAAWIDDKLVGFTHTYFEMYFTEQYQKESMETDPVMDIRFPRAFAAGTAEHQGQTYHFYTNESLQAFEQDPSLYVGSR